MNNLQVWFLCSLQNCSVFSLLGFLKWLTWSVRTWNCWNCHRYVWIYDSLEIFVPSVLIIQNFSWTTTSTRPLKSVKRYYLQPDKWNFAMKMSHVRLSSSCQSSQSHGLQTLFLFSRKIFHVKPGTEALKAW